MTTTQPVLEATGPWTTTSSEDLGVVGGSAQPSPGSTEPSRTTYVAFSTPDISFGGWPSANQTSNSSPTNPKSSYAGVESLSCCYSKPFACDAPDRGLDRLSTKCRRMTAESSAPDCRPRPRHRCGRRPPAFERQE